MHLLKFEPWMGVAMYMHEVIIISLLFFILLSFLFWAISVFPMWGKGGYEKLTSRRGVARTIFSFVFLTVEWQLPSFASIGQTDLCNQIQVPKDDGTWKPLILRPGAKRDLLNPAKIDRPKNPLHTYHIFLTNQTTDPPVKLTDLLKFHVTVLRSTFW